MKLNKEKLSHEERRVRRQQLANDVKDGISLSQIYQKYQLSLTVIRESCREHNVKLVIPSKEGQTPSYKIIAMLLNTSLPMSKIGEKCGVSRSRVQQIYVKCITFGIKVQIRKRGRHAEP